MEQGENNRMAAFARTASGLGQLSPSSTNSPTTTTSLACMEEKDLREIAKVLGDIPRVVVSTAHHVLSLCVHDGG